MKRRLFWIGGTIFGLAILLGLALWAVKLSLDRRFEELSEKAVSLGMNLTLSERPSNPEAERLRSAIDAFYQESLPSPLETSDYYSESPEDLRLLSKHIAPILPEVFAFSNCKTFGASDWGNLYLEGIKCAEFLLVEGNSAIVGGDVSRVVQAGSAIRRIAHLHPSDGVSGAATLVLAVHIYADLLQRGAYVARTDAELQSIVDEVNRWKIVDFKKTATNLIAEEFFIIDQVANTPINATNPFEYASEMALRTEAGVLKRKTSALRAGIAIYPQWSDDAKVWAAIGRKDIAGADVVWSAEFLKLTELELRRKFASLWATLHLRRRQMQGGPMPSIKDLEALGVEVRDPITGNMYEWRGIDGKKRLYGKFWTYGDRLAEEFLLASDGERERSRKSGK